MGYYIINKMPVFIHRKSESLFDNILFKDKDEEWKFRSQMDEYSLFGENKQKKEKLETQYNYLKSLFEIHPNLFYLDWVWFDIKAHVDIIDIDMLLYDYCHFYNFQFIFKSERDVCRHYLDYDSSYDYFSIICKNKVKKIFSLFRESEFVNMKLVIDPKRINRVVGTLDNFIVYSKDFKLICGKNFEIYPLNFSVANKIPEHLEHEILLKNLNQSRD